jgi:hypothetical protein
MKQLNEFTMLNIIKKQEKQMNLSLCYHTMEIDFENACYKEKVEYYTFKILLYN